MSTPFSRAPHIEGSVQTSTPSHAPNAALLIDFDNVTMGMRSDLSKELKSLLNSDVIKGKVTVQRAYADWRRYPQYIVPLSEASVDLIFAPAYGSSKKNATDIRMAIDGMELVFTRPEIGVYILLTGDSDFSSLVLKLKEYGKYVIGVGIQESSSDILVQNCDEYYSYTSLSGLRKTSEAGERTSLDPWLLVEKAIEQMVKRSDVMRSDRLKQVMLEIDPGFDEKSFGFSKFSRFVTEAAQKGLLSLRKMENGQYEISGSGKPSSGNGSRTAPERVSRSRGGGRRDDSRRSAETRSDAPAPRRESAAAKQADESAAPSAPAASVPAASPPAPSSGRATPASDPAAKAAAYELLERAIRDLLKDQDEDAVRDSDVKRRMLHFDSSFDEAELGFGKFSRFLRQADDDGLIGLDRGENGEYQVRLKDAAAAAASVADSREKSAAPEPRVAAEPRAAVEADGAAAPAPERPPRPDSSESRRLRPRLSSRRRGASDEPPPIFEGQTVTGGSATGSPSASGAASASPAATPAAGSSSGSGAAAASRPAKSSSAAPSSDKGSPPSSPATGRSSAPQAAPSDRTFEPSELKLPTGRASVIKYLSNSYRGVGQKTAEILADELGEELFKVLQTDPDRIVKLLAPARAEKVLEAWNEDFARRRARVSGGSSDG
jgi:uncharacterized protein (TIGR00288 family)